MAANKNQHFVPQYYFRNFNGGKSCISLMLSRDGRIVRVASISDQCSKSNLYGSTELEDALRIIEERHCAAMRESIGFAWGPTFQWSLNTRVELLRAIMLQKSRTPQSVERFNGAQMQLDLELFRHHLEYEGKVELARYVAEGYFHLHEDLVSGLLRQISICLESTDLLADLCPCLLLNHTDYPFIFGDSPVVFKNTFLQNVTSRGVLGLQTPGLQVFMPSDNQTMLMLLDPAVYQGSFQERYTINVMDRSDVSQLNALQLYNSTNTIYFGNKDDEQYLVSLWRAHHRKIRPISSKLYKRENWLLDGKPTEGPVYQTMERQIAFDLDLSFISCSPISEGDYEFGYRDVEMVENHRGWLASKET